MNKVLEIALKEYGTLEIVGDQDNPQIVAYFAKTGNSYIKDDETAWCAAFVGYCLEMAGIKSTRKLNARSYLDFGTPTSNPTLGDIVVFWRESKTSGYGHVAFFIRESTNYVYVLGGNQSDKVCIDRYPKTKVLGYRKY